jgi:hypothetical protein
MENQEPQGDNEPADDVQLINTDSVEFGEKLDNIFDNAFVDGTEEVSRNAIVEGEPAE